MYQVEVFWVVTLFIVVGYQRFRRPFCLHFHGRRGGSLELWNVDILPQRYTVSQSRRSLFVT